MSSNTTIDFCFALILRADFLAKRLTFLLIFWLKSSQAEELHKKNSTNLLVFYFGTGNSFNNLIVRRAVQPFRQSSGLFFALATASVLLFYARMRL